MSNRNTPPADERRPRPTAEQIRELIWQVIAKIVECEVSGQPKNERGGYDLTPPVDVESLEVERLSEVESMVGIKRKTDKSCAVGHALLLVEDFVVVDVRGATYVTRDSTTEGLDPSSMNAREPELELGFDLVGEVSSDECVALTGHIAAAQPLNPRDYL